jgi:hypothetical protein
MSAMKSDDATEQLLAQSREAFEALGDTLGVHLCELGLAGLRRAGDAAVALEALAAPLARVVAAGSIVGLDLLATELLTAARRLAAPDLAASVHRVLIAARRPELPRLVLNQLVDRAASPSSPPVTAATLLAAIDLAVALGEPAAAALCLEQLAALHARLGERPLEAGCTLHAAACWRSAGEAARAATLEVDLVRRDPDVKLDEAALEAAAEALSEAGDVARALAALGLVIRARLASQRPKAAMKALRRAFRVLGDDGALADELALHQLAAECATALGDVELARSHAARVALLGG